MAVDFVKKDAYAEHLPAAQPTPTGGGLAKLAALKAVQVAGTMETTKSQAGKVVSETAEVIPQGQVKVPDQAANVHAGVTRTFNMGNYESIKVSIGLSLPVADDKALIEQAYEFASDWVSTKLSDVAKSLGKE